VQSQYGIAEKDIEIADKALNGTGNTSINSPGSAEAISEAKETMPSDEKKDSIKEVQSVSVLSDSGNIRLTWQASEGVDHYNVYRLKDGAPEKLAEVKSPEYIKKGELWKSYTFRISAVNSEGNESELSDPVGIVVTP
jgi:fibronectin type 3 domain-containing protein